LIEKTELHRLLRHGLTRIHTDSSIIFNRGLRGLNGLKNLKIATEDTEEFQSAWCSRQILILKQAHSTLLRTGFIIENCLRPQVQYNWPYLLS